MTVLTLQAWLNNHGAAIAVDGKGGPTTRNAIIETFRNKSAPAITVPEVKLIAETLGCTTRQIATVVAVESAGAGWDDTGLLKCLWERHYLWRRVKVAIPLLSDPSPGGYTVDVDRDGINDSWEKLADAACRWGEVAFECASFGKPQVMGAHWKALGYPSVLDMVWQLSKSEWAHYDMLARFIRVNNLTGALRSIGGKSELCLAFARGYNGKGQKGYDQHLAEAYRRIQE